MELVTIKRGAHAAQHQQHGKTDEDLSLAEPINVYLVK
jgi:hypothetical protein